MLKRIFLILNLTSLSLFAIDTGIDKIEAYYSNILKSQSSINDIKEVKVIKNGDISEVKDWEYYNLSLKFDIKLPNGGNKNIEDKVITFMNGNIAVLSMIDLKNRVDLSKKYSDKSGKKLKFSNSNSVPNMLKSYYKNTLKSRGDLYNIKTQFIGKSGRVRELKGWKYYKIRLSFKYKNDNGKLISSSTLMVPFVKNKIMITNVVDILTGVNLTRKYSVISKIDDKFYSKKNLVAGKYNASNRIIIFSDPQCPACKVYVPKVLKFAKNNPTSLAVFYSPFPLQMHQSSFTISVLTEIAFKKGFNKTKLMNKVYNSSSIGSLNTSNVSTIIDTFNSATGTDITLQEYKKSKNEKNMINKSIKLAFHLGINHTPSIYYNDMYESRVNIYLNAK